MNPLIVVCIAVASAIIAVLMFVAVVPLLRRNRPRRLGGTNNEKRSP